LSTDLSKSRSIALKLAIDVVKLPTTEVKLLTNDVGFLPLQ
jgi:hypothetical protein